MVLGICVPGTLPCPLHRTASLPLAAVSMDWFWIRLPASPEELLLADESHSASRFTTPPQTQKPGDWRTWGKLDINHQALASKGTTWDSIRCMEFLWNQADTGLRLRAHPYPAPFSATSLTPHRLRTHPQSSTSPWIPMSDFWATPLKTKI